MPWKIKANAISAGSLYIKLLNKDSSALLTIRGRKGDYLYIHSCLDVGDYQGLEFICELLQKKRYVFFF